MSIQKISIYIFLILCYLGLAKNLYREELGNFYIKNNIDIENIVTGSPVTVVLINAHISGLFIKTYYQKWRIVHAHKNYEDITIQSSRHFYNQTNQYIGLSIFRREAKNNLVNYTPLPPGSLFVGDSSFGKWRLDDSGNRKWVFYRSYKKLTTTLGWGSFTPDLDFATKIQSHLAQDKPYFGPGQIFGKNGELTKNNFPDFFQKNKRRKVGFVKLLKRYVQPGFNQEEVSHL
jgi:hypothetical protein